MIKKSFFEKHYTKLVLEGIIKSGLLGIIIGFGVNFLVALAEWIFDFGGIWIAIGSGAGAAVISGVILYFAKFRPAADDIARRVDRLGLEERLITMMELQNDDSYIAMLQREDAKRQLGSIEGHVRLRLSKLVIAFTVVAALLGSSMTTVVGLSRNDVIPTVPEIIDPEDPMSQYVSVSYIVEEGGEIIGEPDQLLLPGSDASTVIAMPEDGWMFAGWDDGNEDPERTDTNITKDVEFVALFIELSEGEGAEGGDGGDDGAPSDGEGDEAQDAPTGGGDGESNNDGSEDSENDSDGKDDDDSSDQDGSSGESSEGNSDGNGSGGGGKWEDSNQFIDGSTYYKDQLEMYYEWAKEIFEQNGEIPPELREFFEKYYDSI